MGMENIQAITPKKRINSIDALRGFALLGIMLLHCMERFDLNYTPVIDSPFWQTIDTFVIETLKFLFAGKSYAVFSLLFGLSFFMQMDSQAAKGKDFRLRFLWRLTLLLGFGYINGMIYMGEFFVVYAVLGIFLIPLYKVPSKWLAVIAGLLFLQLPALISFIALLGGSVANAPGALDIYMDGLYAKSVDIFIHGSFLEVLNFNIWEGQVAKCLWVINNYRYLQLIGLFIVGMLIGRMGIHKDEEKMIKYTRMLLPYSVAWFVVFYGTVLLLPRVGVTGFALQTGETLFNTYANLGMMMIYICGLTQAYYKLNWRKVLDWIAPVGRMSLTNYMAQAFIGVILFYGFGMNLAVQFNYLQSFFVGVAVCLFQIAFSNWWIKRYYYGPMEWLWRVITWFRPVQLRRNKETTVTEYIPETVRVRK